MSAEAEFDQAKKEMRGFVLPHEAVEWLRTQSMHSLQLHLLAEQEDQNRAAIMQWFPKVGPLFAARYIPTKKPPTRRRKAKVTDAQ